MSDSILENTKKILGIAPDYDVFDLDVLININSALSTLTQLGVGPTFGYQIKDASDTWRDFLGDDPRYNAVKSYVYLRVRLLFDPPTTGYHVEAVKEQIKELEWRLNVVREFSEFPLEGQVDEGHDLIIDGGAP